MNDQKAIAQHFHESESDFVKQALDWVDQAEMDYRLVLTKFLNPRQRYIVHTLVNQRSGLKMVEDGIFDQAESKRVVIAPDFYEIEESDFQLVLLELVFPVKFVSLRHKDILGALVHTGLERSGFGDIVVKASQGQVQLAVDQLLVDFIRQEIDRIGKVKTNWREISFNHAFQKEEDGEEQFLLVNSLRLDVVVAAAFNLPRAKAQDLVANGSVQVNWAVIDRVDRQISLKDVISVRKYGRICLESLSGQSKKDKIKAVFNIIHR
ncbi:RNA-binding protein [Fructobacillus evanidus]|uniref:Contains S4-like domain (YlmH) n=1 Tax=Fructobacillus evanidus TaxID=3064281 RepID=A0ABM9MMY2_9LACO|nr:RNA-binding protein YlmH [Fructobacillus sp. LMG 32999]CAK1221947.1 RNA-binding protein YlmH [Fructobacillus sp. LMG 32999]CAK1226906.1 RNA-binding protein YlmH [Fructobacillus sp. LMG 32999]CAK1227296.1 RNA-binding protein YlmH [Fructobacillus sp. LMG 32999]CAK1227505.1 RNA-binding protein YlmH [Fructobacillus sp. LMG 32999]